MAITAEENEVLTRVDAGTPGGELMRRYWHPIYPAAELDRRRVVKVRILCEDLVLYKDRSDQLGLVQEKCPHRGTSLSLAIPEKDGVRCPYHGWCFTGSGEKNGEGRCTETPLEPEHGNLKDRVKVKAYRVSEMGGLIWAYMGPDPVPVLPEWDLFVRPDGWRQIVGENLPCNWLQVMENRVDLSHAAFAHGRLFQWALEREGLYTPEEQFSYYAGLWQVYEMLDGEAIRYRPVHNEFGFAKGQRRFSEPETVDTWQLGMNPIIFPYMLTFGPNLITKGLHFYQLGVPVDNETTWHINYYCLTPPAELEVPQQDSIPYAEAPIFDENGNSIIDWTMGQDIALWVGQGPIADRTTEQLGTQDVMVGAYRRMLREQMAIVARGEEPMNVFRDANAAHRPELKVAILSDEMTGTRPPFRVAPHKTSAQGWLYIEEDAERHMPDRDMFLEIYRRMEEHEMRTAEARRVSDTPQDAEPPAAAAAHDSTR